MGQYSKEKGEQQNALDVSAILAEDPKKKHLLFCSDVNCRVWLGLTDRSTQKILAVIKKTKTHLSAAALVGDGGFDIHF